MTETRHDDELLVETHETSPATVSGVPAHVDRLVVHQIDLARPSPGGIETCIRGLLAHAPEGTRFAVVGVDAGGEVPGRRTGVWERHVVRGREVWFLPVVGLDPGDQRRRVPHSARLAVGLARYLRRLPSSTLVQAHRADVAAVVERLLRRPMAYFVHTQEHGLTGATSDSFWRRAAGIHATVEAGLLRRARDVVVFNPDFAETARSINPRAVFSPTWFEPALIRYREHAVNPRRVLWVGRLEHPKDPSLAIEAYRRLVEREPGAGWTLDVVGDGTHRQVLDDLVATLPPHVAAGVRLLGRRTPEQVAESMADAGVFLMTSHPGYEGFPRVLVEAMASGLPAVVTQGSDTGGLVAPGVNGHVVTGRSSDDLADAIRDAAGLPRRAPRDTAAAYAAPTVVAGALRAGG